MSRPLQEYSILYWTTQKLPRSYRPIPLAGSTLEKQLVHSMTMASWEKRTCSRRAKEECSANGEGPLYEMAREPLMNTSYMSERVGRLKEQLEGNGKGSRSRSEDNGRFASIDYHDSRIAQGKRDARATPAPSKGYHR